MRRLLLLAVLVGCKGAAKPAGTTSLHWQAPAVHDHVTHTRATTLTLDVGGKTLVEQHDERRVTEVLEVEADHPVKVKVRYDQVASHQRLDDDERDSTGPHAGKIYVVWKDGDDVHVTTDDGRDAPDAERDAVREDLADELGRIPGMAQVLLGSAWTPGVTVQLTAAELVLMTEAEPSTQAHAGTITLDGVAGDVATFHATVDAELVSPQGSMSTAQTITIHAQVATGRIVDATVDAKLDGDVQGAKATGTLTASVAATWN
jgi:hypothetical protein